MLRTATTASDAPIAGDAVVRLADEISARLDLRACRFEPFPFAALLPRIETDRIVLLADEPGTRPYATWQPGDGVELRSGPLTLGRFVPVARAATCGVAIPPVLRAQAIAVAERAGAMLARRWTTSDRRVFVERGGPT